MAPHPVHSLTTFTHDSLTNRAHGTDKYDCKLKNSRIAYMTNATHQPQSTQMQFTVLHCSALLYTVLHCTTCTALHCTTFNCTTLPGYPIDEIDN